MLSELLLLLAVLAPGADHPADGSEVLLERVVAVVEGRPLLLSQVRLLQVLKGLDEDAAREALVDEVLMAREAARLPEARVDPAAEERALAELRARVPAAPESTLRRLARRQLAIVTYLDHRFRPLVRITDLEVRLALEIAYPEPADRPPLLEAGPAMRRRLEADQLDTLVEEWVAELRRSAHVRRVERPLTPPAEPSAVR